MGKTGKTDTGTKEVAIGFILGILIGIAIGLFISTFIL